MNDRIQRMLKRWYVKENALFQVICTHDIVENHHMDCSLRSGRARVELHPERVALMSDVQLEMSLRAEAIRILLKHPYERRPFGCESKSMTMGSNLVLADNYNFNAIGLRTPAHYGLSEGQAYEWYTHHIDDKANDDTSERFSTDTSDEMPPREEAFTAAGEGEGNADSGNDPGGSQSQISAEGSEGTPDESQKQNTPDATPTSPQESQQHEPKTETAPPSESVSAENETTEDYEGDEFDSDSDPDDPDSNSELPPEIGAEPTSGRSAEELTDSSALWEEDLAMQSTIDNAIEKIEASQSWGTLPASLVAVILATTQARIDYRNVLAGFRASILSSRRILTRMRPNRRSGFESMGSLRRLTCRLLIAVDVSGSVSDTDLAHFFSIVNRFFRYGIEQIDLLTFDSQVSPVSPFLRARRQITIHGRGGTSFQSVFDFVATAPHYDGLIIFTDGFAPPPKLSRSLRTKVVWVCATDRQLQKHHSWMSKTGRCCAITA